MVINKPFIFPFFSLFIFQTLKKFSQFSQELFMPENWNFVLEIDKTLLCIVICMKELGGEDLFCNKITAFQTAIFHCKLPVRVAIISTLCNQFLWPGWLKTTETLHSFHRQTECAGKSLVLKIYFLAKLQLLKFFSLILLQAPMKELLECKLDVIKFSHSSQQFEIKLCIYISGILIISMKFS